MAKHHFGQHRKTKLPLLPQHSAVSIISLSSRLWIATEAVAAQAQPGFAHSSKMPGKLPEQQQDVSEKLSGFCVWCEKIHVQPALHEKVFLVIDKHAGRLKSNRTRSGSSRSPDVAQLGNAVTFWQQLSESAFQPGLYITPRTLQPRHSLPFIQSWHGPIASVRHSSSPPMPGFYFFLCEAALCGMPRVFSQVKALVRDLLDKSLFTWFLGSSWHHTTSAYSWSR